MKYVISLLEEEMNKRLLLRYVLLCLPFILGSMLYGLGIINIVSSLLFFVGGYVAIKNIFDYRKVRKNISIVNVRKTVDISKGKNTNKEIEVIQEVNKYIESNQNVYRSYDNVPGLKRTRRYTKVRRRVNY